MKLMLSRRGKYVRCYTKATSLPALLTVLSKRQEQQQQKKRQLMNEN